jgi:hypothetical protein
MKIFLDPENRRSPDVGGCNPAVAVADKPRFSFGPVDLDLDVQATNGR